MTSQWWSHGQYVAKTCFLLKSSWNLGTVKFSQFQFEESTRYIHRLRVTLPILGLLDLHDEDSDKGLGVVLKYLCRKLHMEEEEAVKIMKHINDLQVMPINYLEQTCSVDQWFSITHNSVSYSNNSVS